MVIASGVRCRCCGALIGDVHYPGGRCEACYNNDRSLPTAEDVRGILAVDAPEDEPRLPDLPTPAIHSVPAYGANAMKQYALEAVLLNRRNARDTVLREAAAAQCKWCRKGWPLEPALLPNGQGQHFKEDVGPAKQRQTAYCSATAILALIGAGP